MNCSASLCVVVAAAVVATASPPAAAGAQAPAARGAVRGVNLYLLKDPKLTLADVQGTPLEKLELQDTPWVRSEDIITYDVSSHAVALKKRPDLDRPSISLRGTPFVVTAEGERCYLGALWTPLSSFLPPQSTAVIYRPDFGYPQDVIRITYIRIRRAGQPPERDLRLDPRVIRALKIDGQYRPGITLHLDSVEVLADPPTPSVRYTYTIRNAGAEGLYVLDPDRMGSGRFHQFTNGVGFQPCDAQGRPAHGAGYRADMHKALEEVGPVVKKIDTKWLCRLKPAERRTWTVRLGGYPAIPPGSYVCSFALHSPMPDRLSEQPKDGRLWLGQIMASRQVRLGPPVGGTSPASPARADPPGD